MSARPYQSRLITCEVCGRQGRAVQKGRDICQARVCARSQALTVGVVDARNIVLQRRPNSALAVLASPLDPRQSVRDAYVPVLSTIRRSSCARRATNLNSDASAAWESRRRSSVLFAGRYAPHNTSVELSAERAGQRSATVAGSAPPATSSR